MNSPAGPATAWLRLETPVTSKAEGRTVHSGLSVSQRVALALFGRAYIGDMTRPGWRGSLPFYAFRCPTHGLVANYPQGYEQKLDCPICQHALLEVRR